MCSHCFEINLLLQANLRAQQRAQFKQINKEQQKKEERVDRNPYFDQRVSLQIAGRGRRQFKFNEPGRINLCLKYSTRTHR